MTGTASVPWSRAALSLAPASFVMPIDFARLPVAALVGIILYQEALDPYVFIGAAIIFGANYFNILHETRPRPVTTTQK